MVEVCGSSVTDAFASPLFLEESTWLFLHKNANPDARLSQSGREGEMKQLLKH